MRVLAITWDKKARLWNVRVMIGGQEHIAIVSPSADFKFLNKKGVHLKLNDTELYSIQLKTVAILNVYLAKELFRNIGEVQDLKNL